MATSGTIGATVVDVTLMIEHAFRRAGVDTSKITGEQQKSAQDNLYFILSDLANGGVNLWCIAKYLIALIVGQATYPMPVGAVDVLRGFIRTMIYPSGTTISGTTKIGTNFGSGGAATISTVGVTASTTGTQNLTVQVSQDGVTFTTLYVIPAFTSIAGALYWFDLPLAILGQAWQVIETVNPAIGVSAVQFGTLPSDILMAKLTRDQYWYLPNKSFAGKPLQYWYDKQINPQITAWPVPNDPTQMLVMQMHMHIQDVGTLTDTLAIPQRWQNYAIWELASYCANERPKTERNPQTIQFCEAKAAASLTKAEMGESDGAPLQLTPNIRAYTR